MSNIIVVSYLSAAAAYAMVTALLMSGWGRRRIGARVMAAAALSVAWALFMAYAEYSRAVPVYALMSVEVARYAVWLVCVIGLFSAWPGSSMWRAMHWGTHAVWVLLLGYCVWPALDPGAPFQATVPLVGVLLLALTGLVFLEQVIRNADPGRRWALKFLVISLVGLFAYDIFLYSHAIVYREFDGSAWAARGVVDVALAPLLLVAAARNRNGTLHAGVSRHVVFYSGSLLVVAVYTLAMAFGGYYVRQHGGEWGRVAELSGLALAALLALVFASSGQARSRLKWFMLKNFYSLRHDYREQWLQLSDQLAATDSDTDEGLSRRAVRALARTMDSPAGLLFLHDEDGHLVADAEWNMTAPAQPVAAAHRALEFMRERRWIYDLRDVPPLDDPALRAPAVLTELPHAWLLVPLVLGKRLVGVAWLAQARSGRRIDWEDIDLLRTAGSQIAGALAQAINARRLAETRQFEGFNRLTAFLMHDLKNVAAQQSLLLQNAARHKHNPAFVDDMLVTVDNSVRRITRLLDQLRGGCATGNSGRVRLQSVIDKALDGCRVHQPAPAHQPLDSELWVRADSDQLASALEHLLRNAQDAATADGHVAIQVMPGDGHVQVRVEDDGAGMDAHFIRHHLFEPFYTTKASRGMGVGAYQAREYVRSLGGTLDVDSTPGRGTVFTLTLPLVDADDGDTRVVDMRAAS